MMIPTLRMFLSERELGTGSDGKSYVLNVIVAQKEDTLLRFPRAFMRTGPIALCEQGLFGGLKKLHHDKTIFCFFSLASERTSV